MLVKTSSTEVPLHTVIKKQTDDIIISEGTIQPYIYIVKSGKLKAVKTQWRRVQNLVDSGPGDFIGEMAHLGSNKTHLASIVAATEVELIQIEAANIKQDLFKKHF